MQFVARSRIFSRRIMSTQPENVASVSKNFEKNEAKRLAKIAKFNLKKEKAAAEPSAKTEGKEPKKKAEKSERTPSAPVSVIETPLGEKKNMTAPIANSYDPEQVEKGWYSWWESQGFFTPSEDPTIEKYVIPIPPPNVTGSLHLGHALTNAIQDCMIRWNRMHGKSALFLPGTDHAGIATQVVVEKKIMKQRGLTRHDLGREEFIKEVWKWKEQYGDRINTQFKRLGSSNDWTRSKFTMDPDLCEAVNEAFVRLHEEKIIYRDNRLVNWCTKLKTALSNLEVENMELEGRTMLSVPDHDPKKKYEFGVIISFAYEIQDSTEKIIVATTRLETMLGDTAIAVNSKDSRYTHLVGKFAVHPFVEGRVIPIIADDYVDAAFGTGAVKITPAHDQNDYAIGKRHGLQFINIFTDDGKINENGSIFSGLQRFDARVAVLEELKKKGLYVETKDNKMVLPFCGRSGNVIEPLMKPQWWVNSKSMAQAAMEVVRSGELEILPLASEKEWFRWLENIQEWCISRQLWWGHRVPAYFIKIEGEVHLESDEQFWVSARTPEDARAKALARFSTINPSKITLEQDPDVLDTWFSSALWPFSTLGWPNKTKDMELFYPTSLLETGWDILFFWVARMVMMGIKLTGKVPFKKVFCHAMVRDAHGRKMSKSLGNVIDPIDVIEGISLQDLQARLDEGNLDPAEVIKAKEGQKRDYPNGLPACGADALRFTLLTYTYAGRDINLDVMRIEGYRKFCNKLWNATKFALIKLGNDFIPAATNEMTGNESLPERFILAKLNKAVKETNIAIEEMNFMQATGVIYNFWLYEFCDIYIECCKYLVDGSDESTKLSARNTLYTCLDEGLKMIHPLMPYVSEELYQRLPRRQGDITPSICIARFPIDIEMRDSLDCETKFELVMSTVSGIRSMLSNYTIKNASITLSSTLHYDLYKGNIGLMLNLLGKEVGAIDIIKRENTIPNGSVAKILNEDVSIFLVVKGFVDFEQELAKLEKRKKKAADSAAALKKKTEIPDYDSKVGQDIKNANIAKLNLFYAEMEAIEETIKNFKLLRD